MSHVPHELNDEFPEWVQQMADLRQSDTHFKRLAERYHDLNRDIHRAETDVEPTSDTHLTEMRKTRLGLKDEISSYVKSQREPG